MTEQAGSPQREGSSVVVKVLYIEDNDDDVYMLKMRLELLGNFEVLTAQDGEKGCAMAAAEQPDIILMDLVAAGCEEFDTKPIEFDRLVATVRRVLDGRK